MGPGVWTRPNVSICNSYGAKPGLTVTDQDKPSAPSTNISICNSYMSILRPDVTDQDKPIHQKTTSQSVTVTRQNQPQMLQIETVELSAEKQSRSVTSRPRIPYLLLQIETNAPTTNPDGQQKRAGRPVITTGTSGPVKHQLGKLSQHPAAPTPRPGP